MENILNNIYIAVVVILLFGAAIFVHEYGHYWVALRRKLKVEEFAIGFGPKLFSWRAKNGVLWSLRGIPAGGFVKLPQMITSEAIEGKPEEELPPITPLSKILVSVAGPFMNVVFAFAIAAFIYVVGLPQPVNPSIVGYVDPKSDEAKLGIKEGDRVVALEGKPVKTWQDVNMGTILALTNTLQVTFDRAGQQFTHPLKAEVSETFGLKILKLNPKDHPVLIGIKPDGPAAKAGLQTGDEVVNFAGVPVVAREQFIELVRKRPGQATPIEVKRAGQIMPFTVTPAADPTEGVGRIQVEVGSNSKQVFEVMRPGPLPWVQVANVFDQMVSTLKALVYSKQTGVKAKDLSGPVGIISGLAIQVNTDYRLALSFLVLLNINLAVLNMLPIPVLDGGHIAMAILEKLRGKPLSVRFVELTTSAFAILLISFMAYVTFFDVKRFPLFKAMMNADTKVEQATNAPASTPPPAAEPAR